MNLRTHYGWCSVEELSKAIMNELRADEGIRGAKVLPSFINLPDITSVEYVQVGATASVALQVARVTLHATWKAVVDIARAHRSASNLPASMHAENS